MQQLIDEIKKAGAKRVLLQLPEGLKTKAIEIMNELNKNNIESVLSADPVYGACDIPVNEAKQLNCDAIVHIGHNRFYRDAEQGFPVIYFPYFIDIELGDIDFSIIKEERIGLITNIQHMKILSDVKKQLESKGKKAVIGGQVLGCWYVNAEKINDEIDVYLFVGSGKFHPLGINNKKIYNLDLERTAIEDITNEIKKLEKVRYGRIMKAKDAKSFAILVTSKTGQHMLLSSAEDLKKKIEEKGKKAFILSMDEITNERLMGIKCDAFINTACPRIADAHWDKPFVNAQDLEMVLEE